MQVPADAGKYWRRTLRVTVLLLLLWFGLTFLIGFGARSLSFDFFGWPFSFWIAAQGALLVYVAIVAFYAGFMNRLDEQMADLDEQPGGPVA